MIHALISGAIFREVSQRTSKAGRNYATATLRCRDGDESIFVRVTVFSESAQDELLDLRDGDALSVTGPLKAELYTRESNGETRIALSIVADKILPLKAERKQRKEKEQDPRPMEEKPRGTWQSPADGPDDSIPF